MWRKTAVIEITSIVGEKTERSLRFTIEQPTDGPDEHSVEVELHMGDDYPRMSAVFAHQDIPSLIQGLRDAANTMELALNEYNRLEEAARV